MSASFADGTYGAGWNGVGATTYLGTAGQGVTGLLHGDVTQFFTQLGGATLMVVYAFGFTYVVFKIIDAIYPLAFPQRWRRKASTCRSSVCLATLKAYKRGIGQARPACITLEAAGRVGFIPASSVTRVGSSAG